MRVSLPPEADGWTPSQHRMEDEFGQNVWRPWKVSGISILSQYDASYLQDANDVEDTADIRASISDGFYEVHKLAVAADEEIRHQAGVDREEELGASQESAAPSHFPADVVQESISTLLLSAPYVVTLPAEAANYTSGAKASADAILLAATKLHKRVKPLKVRTLSAKRLAAMRHAGPTWPDPEPDLDSISTLLDPLEDEGELEQEHEEYMAKLREEIDSSWDMALAQVKEADVAAKKEAEKAHEEVKSAITTLLLDVVEEVITAAAKREVTRAQKWEEMQLREEAERILAAKQVEKKETVPPKTFQARLFNLYQNRLEREKKEKLPNSFSTRSTGSTSSGSRHSESSGQHHSPNAGQHGGDQDQALRSPESAGEESRCAMWQDRFLKQLRKDLLYYVPKTTYRPRRTARRGASRRIVARHGNPWQAADVKPKDESAPEANSVSHAEPRENVQPTLTSGPVRANEPATLMPHPVNRHISEKKTMMKSKLVKL